MTDVPRTRDERRDAAIATGRLRRTAEIGGLVGGQAVRAYATKAANVTRSADARQAADERRAIEAAGQIVDVLGHMKGAAMKVGQIASFIDPTGLPPEERDRFQAKLASLRDSAPPVEFKKIRKVIEDDLGERLDDVFSELEPEAVAAASIGQVYRARLTDGRHVAVKVQYPAWTPRSGRICRTWDCSCGRRGASRPVSTPRRSARSCASVSAKSSTTSTRPTPNASSRAASAAIRSWSSRRSWATCPASACWSANGSKAPASRTSRSSTGGLQTLVVGVMGQLDATANWHRIMAEWLESGPPSTPLEQEAAFFGTGAGSPARFGTRSGADA